LHPGEPEPPGGGQAPDGALVPGQDPDIGLRVPVRLPVILPVREGPHPHRAVAGPRGAGGPPPPQVRERPHPPDQAPPKRAQASSVVDLAVAVGRLLPPPTFVNPSARRRVPMTMTHRPPFQSQTERPRGRRIGPPGGEQRRRPRAGGRGGDGEAPDGPLVAVVHPHRLVRRPRCPATERVDPPPSPSPPPPAAPHNGKGWMAVAKGQPWGRAQAWESARVGTPPTGRAPGKSSRLESAGSPLVRGGGTPPPRALGRAVWKAGGPAAGSSRLTRASAPPVYT